MQSRIDGRRAAPPRPTLLVGDLAACHAAFDRLQSRVLELSMQQQASISDTTTTAVVGWRDLVPRCRALRETLTSLRELSHFTRQVYECAADVCVRAQDWPEALKALQQLVQHIYPTLTAQQYAQQLPRREQQPQQQQRGQRAVGGPPGLAVEGHKLRGGNPYGNAAHDWDDDLLISDSAALLDSGMLATALRQPEFKRWPEAAGALSLYFACVQQAAADRLDTIGTLRCMPLCLLSSPDVQQALRLRWALVSGDYVSLFKLRSAAPPLVQRVLEAAVPRARDAAVVTMAAAYRNISVATVCQVLALASETQLLACLKLLADRGHGLAQRALSGLQQEEQPAAADLVFRG